MKINKEKLVSFLKKLPPTTFVAVTGDVGKSTVLNLIENIFHKSGESLGGITVVDIEKDFLYDDYLKEVKREGVLLSIIKEEYINIFTQARIIPNVLVVTYLKDATNYVPLIQNFTYTNSLVGSDQAIDEIKSKLPGNIKGKMFRTGISVLPRGGKLASEPFHTRENAALAVRVSEIFEVPTSVTLSVLNSFKGLTGRIEPIKKIKDVTYINDAYSEKFASLEAGLNSLTNTKNVVLIIGGDGDGISEDDNLNPVLKLCHTIITIPGSGTQKLYKILLKNEEVNVIYADSIEDAVKKAGEKSNKGDFVVFSPGFCPTMLCGSGREERSQRFIKAVNTL